MGDKLQPSELDSYKNINETSGKDKLLLKLTDEDAELLKAWRNLNDKEKNVVYDLIMYLSVQCT